MDRLKEHSKSAKNATIGLKVLCLHGYLQNATVFRQKSGGMRKLLKGAIEFGECAFE